MDPFDRADAYLTIPNGYATHYGGLHWSTSREAIERQDGSALLLSDELSPILEGVFSRQPVTPFPFVLALIHGMKRGDLGEFQRLHRALQAAKGTAARGRNAGLLIAELCRELPPTDHIIDWQDVGLALRCLRLYREHYRPELAKEPSLTPTEFECRVTHSLTQFNDGSLVHWFKYGCAPSDGGEQLSKQEDSLSKRLARVIDLARQSPRLVGATALVPVLDAALTLPPRRRSPESLPQGGYCDVTTRGNPEQLLPAQFALDPDEFVRRFAANELLYFKREEPHRAQRPDRTIVLDQGVRTWGSVRLALAAAAFALLGKDQKKYGSVELFHTAANEPIDLMHGQPESAVDCLEASDLTFNPAECLTRALKSEGNTRRLRDVILLTHPRNLNESEVISAAESRHPGDRLFVAAVDEEGQAELSAWSPGGLITVKSFKIDLDAAENIRIRLDLKQIGGKQFQEPWLGDVEPVPFPFRPGLIGDPQHFAFDADGEGLVTVTRDGVLQRISLNGSPPEILPRAFKDGKVLKQVNAILGVTGGVVVCGRMTPDRQTIIETSTDVRATKESPSALIVASDATYSVLPPRLEYFVAAHYDWTTHQVTLHFLCPATPSRFWTVHPDLHCIAVRTSSDPLKSAGIALDLTTHGMFPSSSESGMTTRARLAWERSVDGGSAPHSLSPVEKLIGGHLYLKGNTLCVQWGSVNWELSNPLQDGKPLLEGAAINNAQLAGDVLAVSMSRTGERLLVLFRGSTNAVLGQLRHPIRQPYALSPDGRYLAHRDAAQAVVVSECSSPANSLATASRVKLHNNLEIRLRSNPFQLIVAIGTFGHTFSVFEGRLRYSLALGWDKFPDPKGSTVRCHLVDYDSSRFPPSEVTGDSPWKAVVDCLGQILLLAGKEMIAAFLIRRDRAAAWIPGGIFWGDIGLIGGPPSPDAEAKIGRAIMTAAVCNLGA